VDDVLGSASESFVALNGEPLGARGIATDTVAYWVSSRDEAVGFFAFPTSELVTLFGSLPEGKKNTWAKRKNFDSLKAIGGFTPLLGPNDPGSPKRPLVPLPRRPL
jgi:hypothetical protein